MVSALVTDGCLRPRGRSRPRRMYRASAGNGHRSRVPIGPATHAPSVRLPRRLRRGARLRVRAAPAGNAGAAVPVRFALTDAAGTPIADAVAQALAAACSVRVRLDGGAPGARYDACGDRFEYVLKTPQSLASGTHKVALEVVFAGGMARSYRSPWSATGDTAGVGFTIFRPVEVEWVPRGEDDSRTIAALSDALTQSRANIWRYPPGARGRRHLDNAQEEAFRRTRGHAHRRHRRPPERHAVPRGGVLVVEQGTILQLRNAGTDELVLFIYGAPPVTGKASSSLRFPRERPFAVAPVAATGCWSTPWAGLVGPDRRARRTRREHVERVYRQQGRAFVPEVVNLGRGWKNPVLGPYLLEGTRRL